MKKSLISGILMLTATIKTFAFCGFYVAKADAKLFNKSSQVIIVRNGEKSIITMSSDFQGDVKDFAMVVPVPQVLAREQIKVVKQSIFEKLDAYSAPRLVEYYDHNPCYNYDEDNLSMIKSSRRDNASAEGMSSGVKKGYGVTIEAKYTVGNYDILILSAKESSGLENWLTDNGYKIPSGAKEVLEPYIKSNLKFFVVKVNLDKYYSDGGTTLNPLQISFNSPKFMLPIRLGMANAEGNQDMIVYALSQKGRIETTNYRTVKIPTDRNVPEFVKKDFGKFYKAIYKKAWKKESGNCVFLEYAWDVSPKNYMKCDPCVGTPPVMADLQEAGVDWLSTGTDPKWGTRVSGDVYFTRLHLTYGRTSFPQDLAFQETPEKENFQGRYIITYPYKGQADCAEARPYFKKVHLRRLKELDELQALTGWDKTYYPIYASKYEKYMKEENPDEPIKEDSIGFFTNIKNNNKGPQTTVLAFFSLFLLMLSVAWVRYRKIMQ